METTQAHATMMCGMLERLKNAGLYDKFIDTDANPA
jgi:hypothetical protein